MPEDSPDFLYIVPAESPLGTRHGQLPDNDLAKLVADFQRAFGIAVYVDHINEDDEPTIHHGVVVAFDRYEISFVLFRLLQIRRFEDTVFED